MLFYVRPDWEKLYPIRESLDRQLWEVDFLGRPTDDRWHVWQPHGSADVEGISGSVDLDVMRAG